MREKRVLLITIASVETILLCFLAPILGVRVQNALTRLHYSGENFVEIARCVNVMAIILYSILFLAVVDFFFCMGQKRYNKSMFGIAMAMISFAFLIAFFAVIYSYLNDSVLENVRSFEILVVFLLWVAVTILTYLGLVIAYIVVKAKYLKTTSANL